MRKVNDWSVRPSIFHTVLPLMLGALVLIGSVSPVQAQKQGTEKVYSGSLRLQQGAQSGYYSYPEGRRREAVLLIKGVVVGQEATLLLEPRPAGIPSYNYEIEFFNQEFQQRKQDAPFEIRAYLPGQSDGLRVRHLGGGRVILQEILLMPEGTPRPSRHASRQYDERHGIQADGAWGWPTERKQQPQTQAVRPVPADPYTREPYREPYTGSPWPGIAGGGNDGGFREPYYPGREPAVEVPVPHRPVAAPTQVVLYRGEMKVRENQKSRQFLIPQQRKVKSIIVEWSDKDHKATGYLLVNGEGRSRYRGLDVGSPSRDRWELRERIDSFRILARGDHIFLKSVSVIFDNFYDDPVVYPERPVYPGGNNDNVVTVRGGFVVRKSNYSQPIPINNRRTVERVVVYWNDDREDASGYLVMDNEPWNARRGAGVESPGSATFHFNKRGKSLRLYARGDDIYVDQLKIYYAPVAYRQ